MKAERDRVERERFALYKRAHFLKKHKANSISGTCLGEKLEFYFDWEARQLGIKKGKKKGRRSLQGSTLDGESEVSPGPYNKKDFSSVKISRKNSIVETEVKSGEGVQSSSNKVRSDSK